MTRAGCASHNAEVKLLVGIITGYRTGNYVCAGAVAVEVHLIDTVCLLLTVGHEPFMYDQLRISLQVSDSRSLCGVNALYLHHFHLHGAALVHVYLCDRVEDTLAAAVA